MFSLEDQKPPRTVFLFSVTTKLKSQEDIIPYEHSIHMVVAQNWHEAFGLLYHYFLKKKRSILTHISSELSEYKEYEKLKYSEESKVIYNA